MILLKPHVRQKSGLNAKMLLANQNAEFLKFNISGTIGDATFIFLHEGAYLLILQIDDLILHEWVQACPKMLLEH